MLHLCKVARGIASGKSVKSVAPQNSQNFLQCRPEFSEGKGKAGSDPGSSGCEKWIVRVELSESPKAEKMKGNQNMKQLIHLKSAVARVKRPWLPILCGTLLAGTLVIGPTSQVARGQRNPNPGVIPPHAQGYGLSYGEWGAQW